MAAAFGRHYFTPPLFELELDSQGDSASCGSLRTSRRLERGAANGLHRRGREFRLVAVVDDDHFLHRAARADERLEKDLPSGSFIEKALRIARLDRRDGPRAKREFVAPGNRNLSLR